MTRRVWFHTLALMTVATLVAAAWILVMRTQSARSRLPLEGRETLRLSGCPGRVEVLLDGRGVPHVRAESSEAAFFAQGYLLSLIHI